MKSARLLASNYLWLALSSSSSSSPWKLGSSRTSTIAGTAAWTSMAMSMPATVTRAMASSLAASGGENNSCDKTNNADKDENENAYAALSLSELANYHPVVVEGMGYYDPRDANTVASTVVASIRAHLDKLPLSSTNKPLLVITQGDPLTTTNKGISAITPLVAKALSRDGKRGLVCLDSSIDPSHSRDADRTNVVAEVRYSQLVDIILNHHHHQNNNTNTNNGSACGDDTTTIIPTPLETLEAAIDDHILELNKGRKLAGKPPVKDYFKTYALLQEVTKAGLKILCGGGGASGEGSSSSSSSITIAHTSAEINPFSVTSFYKVGLRLGLYDASEVVAYDTNTKKKNSSNPQQQQQQDELLDFDTIDPR